MARISESYDYVIVGAGSAGSVVANRLGEDKKLRILVLEAGGSDRALTVQMPAALSIPMNSKRFNWGMKTEPEPGLGGRRVNLPRGKGLGGSSSINGMCYVRGNPLDYELWAALGAAGWNWANVLPYFQKLESVQDGGDLRGCDGPLKITRGPETNPLYHAFVEAAHEAGYPKSTNMNERQHEGFGPMEMTVAKGKRCSAAVAYLRPAVARGNVQVLCNSLVDKVVFNGTRAEAVDFSLHGTTHRVKATYEIILCAGSIMSPVILKRSGIGPAAELAAHGIPVVADCAQVGENLMDHLELYLQHACLQPVSLYPTQGLLAKAMIGLQWLLTKRGLGATNHFESGGHVRSRAGIVYPDIQFHFLPLAISYDGKSLTKGHGFQVHVGTKRSKSRGFVRLRDANPASLPKVQFNYMTHPDDWLEFRACIALSREIFNQPALAGFAGPELAPGPYVIKDTDVDTFIKQKVESAYHPCGTCKMGEGDEDVTDPQARVRGVQGLRVVDASLMPQATAGDLNGPTIMLAERCSDLIKGKVLPAANDAPLLVSPNWLQAQRSWDMTHDYANDRDSLRAALLLNAQNCISNGENPQLDFSKN